MPVLDNIVNDPVIDVTDSIEINEIWIQKKPKKSDHIRVKRIGGLYSHHGVYVSDEEVIHFTGQDDDSILDWSKCEVISTDLDTFLKDGILEVKEYTNEEFQDLYLPDQIVEYARSCIGDKGYNLIFNNCEHFANVCTLGRFRSNQVERVLSGKMPNEEGNNKMGLFGAIGGFFNGLFGGRSSNSGASNIGNRSTTTYEPDKVKTAKTKANTKTTLADKEIKRIEIENRGKLDILKQEAKNQIELEQAKANMEKERIEIEKQAKLDILKCETNMEKERVETMKQAKLDILEYETESRIALKQAEIQGNREIADIIVAMQEKMNEVAKKRLQIIESGSIQIIKEIETFYDEIGNEIEADNHEYNRKKLPELLDILKQYERGTPEHDIYFQQIQDDRKIQQQHYIKQFENVSKRQDMVISGFISSKEKIIEQTGQITNDMLESAKTQALQLNADSQALTELPDKSDSLALLDNNN